MFGFGGGFDPSSFVQVSRQSMANSTMQTGNLEYGVNRGNGNHFVQFNAREVIPPSVLLAGGAHTEEPDNSPTNKTDKGFGNALLACSN